MKKGNIALNLLVLFLVVVVGLGYLLYSKGYFNMSFITGLTSTGESEVQEPVNPGTTSSSSTVVTSETGNVSSAAISVMVTSPQDGASLTSGSITVTGKTSPGADVFVNDQETTADASGNFSAKISLDEGPNTIIVTANDAQGNAAESDINVNVQTFQ